MRPATVSPTINARQRSVLFRLVAERLAHAGTVYLCLAQGKSGAAKARAGALEQDLRFMGAIGWEVDDPRQAFVIEIEPPELLVTLARLAEGAERSLARIEESYGRDNADAASAVRAAKVCRQLMASLDGA